MNSRAPDESNQFTASLCLGFIILGWLFSQYAYYSYHEPWRDEALHYLIAVGFTDFSNFVEILRLDGHPPLWHLVARVFYEFGADKYSLHFALALGQIVLISGTYAWIRTIVLRSDSALFLTLCFSLTYVYAYEFGMISRSYGFGMGFCFFGIGYSVKFLRSKIYRDYYLAIITLSLAIFTAVHSAILACAVLAALNFQLLLSRSLNKTIIIPWILPLLSLAVLLFIIRENPDRAFGPTVAIDSIWKSLGVYLGSITTALPKFLASKIEFVFQANHWWLDIATIPGNFMPHFLGISFIGSIVFWFCAKGKGLIQTPNSIFYILVFILNTIVLGFLLIHFYEGYFRHHLFIFWPYIVFVICITFQFGRNSSTIMRSVSYSFVLSLFLPMWASTYQAYQSDINHPFSNTQNMVPFLTPESTIYADEPFAVTPLIYHSPNHIYTSARAKGRNFTYVVFDNAYHKIHSISQRLIEACQAGPVDLVLAYPPNRDYLKACANLKWQFPENQISGSQSENFFLYDFDCDCFFDLPEIRPRIN